jgi:hypothetical protein
MKTSKTTAYCIRTKMCGGGTSYDVYFRKADKPSHPLHNNHTYATVICRNGKEFFEVRDAIDPESHWRMEAGLEKWDAFKRLEKKANRLAVRIAKRAFPELAGARELPFFWAPWTLPSAEVKVPVRMQLPV